MKVIEMTTNAFWKGELGVKGLVEDGTNQYKVSLYVKGGHVYDYSCSCAEGNSFRGMCSHGKRLFDHYKTYAGEENLKPVSTSQEVRTMIREYTNREVAEIITAQEEDKVRLIPRLILGRKEIRLEFKVGRTTTYLVKDLVSFVKAMEQGANVDYGKNLSFHHHLGAFHPEDEALVIFVMELLCTYLEHYEQFKKGSFLTIPGIRSICLSKAMRDRFFELMENKMLEVEDDQGIRYEVVVKKENPQLEIQIKRTGKDGIQVSIDKSIWCFQGDQSLYVGEAGTLYQCDDVCSKALGVFLEQMVGGVPTAYTVKVNEIDIPLFYERVLRKVESYSFLNAQDVDLETYQPPKLNAKFEFDSLGSNQITMRPTLSYGDFSFHPVEDERLPRTVCRDVPGEFRISRLITKYFRYREQNTDNLVLQNDEEGIYQLLTQGIQKFQALGEVYISDNLKAIKVLPVPKVSVGVRTYDNWLELTLETGEMSGTELINILNSYKEKKRYYRLQNGEFLKLEDHGMMAVAKLAEGLAFEKMELAQKKIRLPKYRAFYLDCVLKEGEGIGFFRDQRFKSIVRGMKSLEDSDYEIPLSLQSVLRGYQKIGFTWLKTLDAYGFGGILADDMGLGKTIQIISVLLEEAEHKKAPSLIVCPASLVYNWENECNTFAPSLNVNTIVGSASERKEKIRKSGGFDVIITSYDLLKRDILMYQDVEFRFQVIDEAQYIKNAGTQSAKAVKAVKAQTRFALTGTPVENRLSELWSIFDYLMPGFLFGYQKFKKEYEVPIVKDGNQQALESLHRMIGPFILRRLKQDVLKELPEKLETVVYSKLEDEQRELYCANALLLKQQLENSESITGNQIQILAGLTRLRQICCDPTLCYDNYKKGSAKLETCMELIGNGIASGHKILLFSQFTSMLDIIGRRLKKEGIKFYSLTGSTPKESRMKMVNAFSRENIPIFLISLKAGGTGLNLTAADMVIHYDPWWNVAAQNQATDRAHRIGQLKQVSVFKLITKHTIEENILMMQDAKKNLADQVITEGTVSLSSLTKEALLELLKG